MTRLFGDTLPRPVRPLGEKQHAKLDRLAEPPFRGLVRVVGWSDRGGPIVHVPEYDALYWIDPRGQLRPYTPAPS